MKAPKRSHVGYSKSEEDGTRKEKLEFNVGCPQTRSDSVRLVNKVKYSCSLTRLINRHEFVK